MALHHNSRGANNHTPYSWEVADEAERLAITTRADGTPLSSIDLNCKCLQSSDSTEWILIGIAPVLWRGISSVVSSNTNTVSSIGSGTSIYAGKVADDFQFNAIKSENNLLTVALDAVSHDVELTVNQGNISHNSITDTHNLTTDINHNSLTNTHNLTTDIDHDATTNFVANEHIDHSTVSISTGGLLTGGGDLTANRTITLAASSVDHGSISGLTDDDHTQYHNDTRGDARYYRENEHISVSAGAGDASKPIITNASGVIDSTLLPTIPPGYTDEQAQDAVATIMLDSSSIDFTYNDGIPSIVAAVIPGGVNHNLLSNYSANRHIDHSGVSVLAGGILTGGGDLTANRTISLTSGNVDHDATTNFVANEHIDHTAVSISAGGILTGGGTIAANRTISLAQADVNHNLITNTHNLTTDIDHDATTNFVANEHINHTGVSITGGGILTGGGDLTANRTISLSNANIDHDATTNFVANEHIDHTTVSVSAGVGLTGGGTIAANRTLSVDINGTTEETSITDGDFVLIHDTSGNVVRKMTRGNFVSGIAGAGESNTASNAGAGIDLFYQKVGVDLQFNSIKSETNRLSIALDAISHDVELTIEEANIVHNNLSGYSANRHIDHTAVSISAGGLLTGGGDLSASRTITLAASSIDHGAISNTHNLTTDINHSTITGGHNLTTDIDHNALTNYSANRHVDHSTVSIATAAGTSGLSGGGTIASTRNITVDIHGTTEETTIADDDEVLIYDISASGLRRMTKANFLVGVGGAADWAESNILYVGKHGNDANDGTNISKAFLSFTAAINAAVAAGITSTNRYTIMCVDAGTYSENITLPRYVSLQASSIVLVGNHIITDVCIFRVGKVLSSSGYSVTKTGINNERATVQISNIETTAGSGAITIDNGALDIDVKRLTIVAGIAVYIPPLTTVEVCGSIGKILLGTNCNGIYIGSGGSSEVNIIISSIVNNLTATGTTAFYCTSGTTNIITGIVNTTKSVFQSGGILNLTASSISGWVDRSGGVYHYVSNQAGANVGGRVYADGFTALGTGTEPVLDNSRLNAFDTVNDFLQLNIQNLSAGASASSDIVAGSDTGSDVAYYIDMGINSSGWNDPAWTINGANDSYVYASDGNIAIGTSSASKEIVLFTGGTLLANKRCTITDATSIFTNALSASNLSGTNTGDETNGTIKTKLGAATNLVDGYLTAADWILFNSKLSTVNWGSPGYLGETNPTTGQFKCNTAAVIGSELITNSLDSDFSGANNWVGINWTILSNAYFHNVAGANDATLPTYPATAGLIYQVVMTIVTTTPGTLTIRYGGVSASAIGQVTGTLTNYTVLLTATGAGVLTLSPNATWLGSVDNVSIKQVTESVAGLNIQNASGAIAAAVRTPTTTSMGIGNNALRSNISAASNLAMGSGALRNNTTGTSNAAIGSSALRDNTTGLKNTAIGGNTLLKNISGNYNVALGTYALRNNVTGERNVALGQDALYNNITGTNNTGIGLSALYYNTIGTFNIGIGGSALFGNTDGSFNIGIGYQTGGQSGAGNNGICIGYRAGRYNSTAGRLYIDGFDRANTVNGDARGIIVGQMSSDVASQTLTLNAATTVSNTLTATQFRLSALNTAPASASATGTLGEIRIVNGFIYVCVATDTWQRAAIDTWV